MRAKNLLLFKAPTLPSLRHVRGVDLFAGAGGTTTGATWAGVRIIAAANHSRVALATHYRNHQWLHHLCEDISVMDPGKVGRHDIGLASPACTGHTNSRGKERDYHDKARMTAYGVISVWTHHQPKLIQVENVREFLLWSAPDVMKKKGWQKRLEDRVVVHLGDGTQVSHPAGKVFMAWKGALEALGYSLTLNLVDASRFGVPQERVRLIIAGSLKRAPRPIEYPTGLRIATVGEIIDWDAGEWNPISEKVESTRARWARGRREFGKRFVMPYYGEGSGLTGRSLDRPLGTIPCADIWGVVKDDKMRMLSARELLRAMSFPEDYVVMGRKPYKHEEIVPWGLREDVTEQIGNAVPPLMAMHATRQLLEAA